MSPSVSPRRLSARGGHSKSDRLRTTFELASLQHIRQACPAIFPSPTKNPRTTNTAALNQKQDGYHLFLTDQAQQNTRANVLPLCPDKIISVAESSSVGGQPVRPGFQIVARPDSKVIKSRGVCGVTRCQWNENEQ